MGRGHWESHAGQTVVVGSTAAGSGDPTGTTSSGRWEGLHGSRRQKWVQGNWGLLWVGSPPRLLCLTRCCIFDRIQVHLLHGKCQVCTDTQSPWSGCSDFFLLLLETKDKVLRVCFPHVSQPFFTTQISIHSVQEVIRRACWVVQWLRIRLSKQGTQVPSLVWEDSICCGAAKPVCHNY